MLVEEIRNARVQAIIADWTQRLSMQKTSTDSFGKIEADDVESTEVKQALEHFAEEGLTATIKKNNWFQKSFLYDSNYEITFRPAA